jgi:hypothetical protein
MTDYTDPPKYPAGTPEHEAYAAELRTELDKWVAGDAPYLLTIDEAAEPAARPTVVTLCGSTRFKSHYAAVNAARTLAGDIVLSCGLFGHADQIPLSDAQKAGLDELHLRKIDMSDEIFVINVGGYIGQSTRREIAYARAQGKPVYYLEPTFSAEADEPDTTPVTGTTGRVVGYVNGNGGAQ